MERESDRARDEVYIRSIWHQPRADEFEFSSGGGAGPVHPSIYPYTTTNKSDQIRSDQIDQDPHDHGSQWATG